MALEKTKNQLWFREELYSDVAQLVRVSKILARKKTAFQDLAIFETPRFGKMLVLDNIIQTTELDEKYYHEPLVHCALFSLPDPKHILIIGGGDGGALRELAKHPVKSIDLVEIDKEVIGLVQKHMPDFAGNAWNDKRLKIHIDDGARFVKKSKQKYDVIIVDSPDPVGPAKVLFKTDFYLDCKKILSSQGILIRQSGSAVFQPEEMPTSFRQMEETFPDAGVFLTVVPTYIGGYFSFVAGAMKKGLFARSLKYLKKRFKDSKIKTVWYNPQIHKASQVLPRELESSLSKTEYGQELVIDLYGCDYETLISPKKNLEFLKKVCEVIKMKPYGRPFVADFGHALSKTAGFSLVQLIESSSITAHYSPHWRILCLNIFSCTSFDVKKAVEFAKNYFGAERAIAFVLRRGGRVFGKNDEIVSIAIPEKIR